MHRNTACRYTASTAVFILSASSPSTRRRCSRLWNHGSITCAFPFATRATFQSSTPRSLISATHSSFAKIAIPMPTASVTRTRSARALRAACSHATAAASGCAPPSARFIISSRRASPCPAPSRARGESDLVGELATRLTQLWSATADLQWNPDDDKIQKGGILFHYQRDQQHLFNAGYRFRRGELDQSDFSLLWPINPQWQFVGRWNYSYRDHRPLESLAGLQYDSCCWTFRITSRRYVSSTAGDTSRALYLQLELKGLAAIGQSVDEVLERGILGYRPR